MTQITKTLIYPELSYQVVGILFEVHNALGRFCKEKQYQDGIEKLLKRKGLKFDREKKLPIFLEDDEIGGNQVDFLIEDIVLLECKAKSVITKDDYYQLLRYLKASRKKLGLLVNFRNKYLRPKRIVN